MKKIHLSFLAFPLALLAFNAKADIGYDTLTNEQLGSMVACIQNCANQGINDIGECNNASRNCDGMLKYLRCIRDCSE